MPARPRIARSRRTGAGTGGTQAGEHQNIARAALVLEALSKATAEGLRLTDVAAATGLNKATAHRVLAGLVAHQLAEQPDASARYVIGMRVFSWASSAATRFNLLAIADKGLQRLAHETRDTVYLSIRSQDELVCLDRREGTYPIKTLTLEVGARRPLGISAGGLALLACLQDDEIDRILASHADPRMVFPFDPMTLRQMIATTRANGFAWYDAPVLHGREIIEGMAALAVPVRGIGGQCHAAISVAALTERLQPPRQAAIVEAIQREVATVENAMGAKPGERA